MRRRDIEPGQVYAEKSLGSPGFRLTPVIPVVATADLTLTGRFASNPIVRRRDKARRSARPGLENIGLKPARDEHRIRLDVWAESRDEEFRPLLLDAAFEVAEQLRTWMDTIPEGEQRVVPDGMIPADLWLDTFYSRDVVGDWLTQRGEQMARDREERKAEARATAELLTSRDAFAAVADRALRLLDISEVKPGANFHGRTDYTLAQLPLRSLIAILDELERARDATPVPDRPAAPGGAGGLAGAQ